MLDNEFPMLAKMTIRTILYGIFSLTISSISTPPVIVIIVIVGIGFYYLLRFYSTVIREVRRRASIAQSPIFSLL